MPQTPEKPLKICHIHLGEDHGGAETFFLKLGGALARRGVAQTAFVRRGVLWADRLRSLGCTVVELPFGKGLAGLLANWQLRRQIRRIRPAAVMAWMDRAARRMPAGPWLKIARLGGYYRLKHYRRCDHLVGNTPGLVTYMREQGWPEARTHMISNFPDFKPAAPLARARMDTPQGAPLLIALGRLHPSKGFDLLLDAMAQLPDDTHLWLLGEGGSRAALAAQAQRLGLAGRVHMPGWVDTPAPYIAAADLFVVPSRHEPLGNVVLEAWAMQKPVVSTASEGPSWLIEDGVSGLLAPIDDTLALAQAMARALGDEALRQKLVAGGTARLEAAFSEAAIADAYIELFRKAN